MNYPDRRKLVHTTSKASIVYGNRGMNLESEINLSNTFYREIDKAIIYKKPTPIKISKVDYKQNGQVIREGFFEKPSTTDYNGIYKGHYIDFEAKETKSSTSFPLANIHEHQIKHLLDVQRHGGICFLIVRFLIINKTFLLPSYKLEVFLEEESRKSIPLSYFLEHGILLKDGYNPRIDYLKAVDEIYGGVLYEKQT